MADLDPRLYTVAWIAPLEIEAQAALHMLDNQHPGRFRMERGDDYVFQAGDACGHNIIIATLPAGEPYGTGSAAALASQVKKFFPNLWFGLLVGVAAGLPDLSRCPPRDIRLGDVLVGLGIGDNAGLVPYDLGKETGNGFELLRAGHWLARTETVVRSAIGSIKLMAPNDVNEILQCYKGIEHREHSLGTFADPGQERDALYEVDESGVPRLVQRAQRPVSKRTRIWYGSIGSGEKLMKNALKRNELRDKYDLIGLEMEAAGTMDRIPVGVIRGVCDYGDEHKNKEWQPYAAAMAAAYARAILARIGPLTVSQEIGRSPSCKRGFDEVDEDNSMPAPKEGRDKRSCYGGGTSQGDSSENMPLEDYTQNNQISSHTYSAQNVRAKGNDRTNSDKERPATEVIDKMDATMKQSLIEQLYFDKIDDRLVTLTAAHVKTCHWFLDKPEYKSWNDPSRQPEHGGFLWVSGHPGFGKSTLIKFLFEKAKTNTETKPSQILLSFFFLARGTIEEKSTTGLYRSLLHQLFQKAPETQNGLDWMTADGAKIVQRNGWNKQALKQTLMHAVQKLGDRSLTIFVDALDECNRAEVVGMVCFFEELCDSAQDSKVRLQVCFSSRYYPIVVIRRGLQIRLDKETGHTADIEHYIKSTLRLGKSSQANLLRSEILKKSSGIFLWVVLVLGILNEEYANGSVSIKRMHDRLEGIPPGLDELFEMILTRNGDNLDRLDICLRWILFATRPLKPQVLYFAVQFGLGKECTGYWDREEAELDEMKAFVTSSSKGLAEITRNKTSEVQLIHESVRDFLQKKYETQWSASSANFIGNSHTLLRDCCWAQLRDLVPEAMGIEDLESLNCHDSVVTVARKKVNSEYPFLEYATVNILHHANRAQNSGIDQRDFLATFSLDKWILVNNFLEKHRIRRYTKSVSLLYILAEKNFAGLILVHPEESSCFKLENQDERYGTPIFAALAAGSREAAWTLLKKQAETLPLDSPFHRLLELYRQDRNRPTNLSRRFSFSRRREILSYLEEEDETLITSFLLTSSGPTGMQYGGEHVLVWASRRGYAVVVENLLGSDVRETIEHSVYNEALFIAAAMGHEAVIRMFVEDDARHLDSMYTYGRSLYVAAEQGHEAIVRSILERNAMEVNNSTGCDHYPLIVAAEKGHEALVRLFLNNGATNVNIQDASGRSPLHVAAEKGHEAVVKLFLNNGATNVNIQDASGQSPLHVAAEKGHEAVVRLLLNNGATNVNIQDASGRSPLHVAAENQHDAVVKELLEDDAIDPNLRDSNGNSPLHVAAKGRPGAKAVVKLLLEKDGTDCGIRDGSGRQPLELALSHKRNAIVKVLLAQGFDFNYEDTNYWTSLSHAITSGNEVVFKALIANCGLDIDHAYMWQLGRLILDAKTSDEAAVKTLLSVEAVYKGISSVVARKLLETAAAEGHAAVMKAMLVAEVACKHPAGDATGYALLFALDEGHEALVRALLTVDGIDINYKCSLGRTALSIAAQRGNDAMLKLLLSQGGVDLNHKENSGATALICAAKNGDCTIVKLLIAQDGIQMEDEDGYGMTALSWAALSGGVSVLILLLGKDGIDVNHPDHGGLTPLALAAYYGKTAVAMVLCEASNVNLDFPDHSGRTPLLLASAGGHDAFVSLLLRKGVDIQHVDEHGQTALSVARDRGHKEVVKVLESYKGQR